MASLDLDGHEFEQTLGDDGQGGLARCSPWGCKESDATEQLKNSKNNSAYKLNNRVTIHSLDVLLSQFGTSPLFHVQL